MTIIVSTVASASARDYAWLLEAMKQRSGNRTDLDALLPDFVVLAEKRMDSELDSRYQDLSVTLTSEAGTPEVALPDDVSEIRSLSIAGYGPVEYQPLDAFTANAAAGDRPLTYTVIGTTLHLSPTPDAAYALTCVYRASIAPLIDSAGTNWLIEKFPNLYLAAAMVELCIHTQNQPQQAMWEQKYMAALASVNKPTWATADALVMRVAR